MLFGALQLISGLALVCICLIAHYLIDVANVKGHSKLLIYTSFVVAAQFVKTVYWDIPDMDTNFYWYFGVDKSASYSSIKRAFRDLALSLHPDQNAAPDAEEQFNLLSFMHDVLHDNGKRDTYNRFGVYVAPNSDSNSISIVDPRTEEFDLIMKISVVFIFWGVLTFVWTIPAMHRAARSWVAILLGIIAAVEFFISFSDATIPEWLPVPGYLTEYELLMFIHASIPCLLLICGAISEYCYKDPNHSCMQIIGDLIKQQKINEDMISYMKDLIDLKAIGVPSASAEEGAELLTQTKENVDRVLDHLEIQKQELLSLNRSILTSLEEYKLLLTGNRNDPLAKLYWYAIIAMLLGAQYFQNKV